MFEGVDLLCEAEGEGKVEEICLVHVFNAFPCAGTCILFRDAVGDM